MYKKLKKQLPKTYSNREHTYWIIKKKRKIRERTHENTEVGDEHRLQKILFLLVSLFSFFFLFQ